MQITTLYLLMIILLIQYILLDHSIIVKIIKVLFETKRLLKSNGILIFYNYKTHENYKKYFIILKIYFLFIFRYTGYNSTKIFSRILSFFIYFIFVIPSKITKFFLKQNQKKFRLIIVAA